jgi:hypothetical protein
VVLDSWDSKCLEPYRVECPREHSVCAIGTIWNVRRPGTVGPGFGLEEVETTSVFDLEAVVEGVIGCVGGEGVETRTLVLPREDMGLWKR